MMNLRRAGTCFQVSMGRDSIGLQGQGASIERSAPSPDTELDLLFALKSDDPREAETTPLVEELGRPEDPEV
jgi:hypothetical protein